MQCNECGAILPDNAKYCTKCGKSVVAGDIIAFCRECGHQFRGEEKYCPKYGTIIEPRQDEKAFEQQAESITAVAQSQNKNEPEVRDELKNVDNNVSAEKAPTTIIGWFGWMILTSILPVFGAMIMAVSGDENNKTRQNYGKALLIIQIILLFIAIIEWETISYIIRWLL